MTMTPSSAWPTMPAAPTKSSGSFFWVKHTFNQGEAPAFWESMATIDMLAAQAASFGVTTVWVPGSMGQFDELTVPERKQLLEAWVPAAKKHGLYLIAHVGSSVAQEGAAHPVGA